MHTLAHTGQKSYKCKVCGLALLSGSHLKRHSRVHTGERPYQCQTCGKRFAERYNLVAHNRIHDPLGANAREGSIKKIHRYIAFLELYLSSVLITEICYFHFISQRKSSLNHLFLNFLTFTLSSIKRYDIFVKNVMQDLGTKVLML
jgi:DNA-directed RNA polymerase subunit RPC12/RpoP